jgi:hypothetical protein
VGRVIQVAYGIVVTLELDLGIKGTHGLKGFGKRAIFSIAILVTSVEGMSRHNLLPKWLAPQHSSGVGSAFGLLVWVRRA